MQIFGRSAIIPSLFMAVLALLQPALAASKYPAAPAVSSDVTQEAQESAIAYWRAAQALSSPDREANMLLAADALLKARQLNQAQQLLDDLKGTRYNGNLYLFKRLVNARLALAEGKADAALKELKQINPEQLSTPLQAEFYDLRAQAQLKTGQMLASVDSRIQLDRLLNRSSDSRLNQWLIWQALQQESRANLQTTSQKTSDPTLKGWVDLALLERNITQVGSDYSAEIDAWTSANRRHPGNAFLPRKASKNTAALNKPKHIALLLPLEGKLSGSAQALRDGFLAAYYLDYQNQGQDLPKVTVLDTQGDNDVNGALQRALAEGADMIVGPLTKNGVEQIIRNAPKNVPVLALNTVDRGSSSAVYQFGLSPEDEARQAAKAAWQDGHMNAIVITQAGYWGDRIAQAFKSEWDELGGQILANIEFEPGKPVSQPVKAALNVDQSEARAKQLKETIGVKLEYDVRRRQDVDMIFLAATPNDARQIPPMLAFYFAQNVPIYATSSIYTGSPNPSQDKDLNGVNFCDIAWYLDAKPQNAAEQDAITKLWPDAAQSHQRLYALGVDAYKLIPVIPRLQSLPQFSLNGATGKLSVNSQNKVVRSLRCTQFENGAVKRLNSSV